MIIVFIFLPEVSPKATSLVNEVNITVLGFDKLQPIPKHKLLGKTEFHMHKLAKVCDSRYLLKKKKFAYHEIFHCEQCTYFSNCVRYSDLL